jgi:hypothetical protein
MKQPTFLKTRTGDYVAVSTITRISATGPDRSSRFVYSEGRSEPDVVSRSELGKVVPELQIHYEAIPDTV